MTESCFGEAIRATVATDSGAGLRLARFLATKVDRKNLEACLDGAGLRVFSCVIGILPEAVKVLGVRVNWISRIRKVWSCVARIKSVNFKIHSL